MYPGANPTPYTKRYDPVAKKWVFEKGSFDGTTPPTSNPAPSFPVKEVTGAELKEKYGITGRDPDKRYQIQTTGQDAGKVTEIQTDPLEQYNGLTGPALLEAMSPRDRAEVQALYEGRVIAPTVGGRAKEGQRLLSLATAAYPDFDASVGKQRFKIRQDYTPGGSVGKNLSSFNTVIGHLGTLQDKADKLGNFGGLLTSLNPVKNMLASATGHPEVKEFDTARTAVADEMVRAFRQSGGSLTEIQDWQKKFDSAGSPEQLQAVIRAGTDLLGSRINALVDPYNKTLGVNRSPLSFMNPSSRKTFLRLNPAYEMTDDDKRYLAEEESTRRKAAPPAAKVDTPKTGTTLPLRYLTQYQKVPPANREVAKEPLKAAGYDVSGLN